MDITIHTSTLPHDDPDASLAFWRDALGFEVRNDVGEGKMRRTVTEMMAKGTYGWILLSTKDLDATFERVQASGAEVVQAPMAQDYGVRDCAFRDLVGNLVRIQERR
jgi:predicted enzyme related to lactoylglutathione lyase